MKRIHERGGWRERVSRAAAEWRVAIALLGLTAVWLAAPGSAMGQESVTDIYKQVADQWAANAMPYVIPLFGLLFIVDVALSFQEGFETRGGPEMIFMSIGRRLVVGGMGVGLFLNPEHVAFKLIRAFEIAGTAIGGAGFEGLPDPIMLVLQGWDAFSRLIGAVFIPPNQPPEPSGTWGGDITGILGILRDGLLWVWYIFSLGSYLLGVGVVAVVLAGSFVVLALQVMWIKTQAFLLVSLGEFYVSSLGLRWVEGMMWGYVRIILTAGVKLFMLASLFGIYYLMLPRWEGWIAEGLAAIPRGPDNWDPNVPIPRVAMMPLLMAATTAGLYAAVVWKIPGWFSGELMREVHFSLSRGKGRQE